MTFKIGSLSSPSFVKSILRDAKPVQLTAADLVEQQDATSFKEFNSFNAIFSYYLQNSLYLVWNFVENYK